MESNNQTNCPKCSSPYGYNDGNIWICPECSFEWSNQQVVEADSDNGEEVCDANGNPLKDGDSVTVIKNLKVKGASSPIKTGTKVKNIRLVPDSPDGHNISCKIEGFGVMGLKSEFVKKA